MDDFIENRRRSKTAYFSAQIFDPENSPSWRASKTPRFSAGIGRANHQGRVFVISQGAEATVSRTANGVLKQRLSKSYRHPQIDHALQQFRTRREAKILAKLADEQFPAPRLHAFDDERHELLMSALQGPVLRTIINDNPTAYGAEIGALIGRLHAAGIVHGDLTTSNMILADKKIHLIDFGLSAFSETDEDRAVDLHVLREALEAKHHEVFRPCYNSILAAYQETHPFAAAVLERLKKVELRGKNKKNY